MSTNPNDCLHAMNLGLKRAEEAGLSLDEAEWLAGHLAGCDGCRIEHGALDALAADDTAAPAAPLDDLERHRVLDAVLERAAAAELLPAAEPNRRRRWTLALAAGVAVALLAGLVAWWGTRGPGPAPAPAPSPAAPSGIAARLALVTGETGRGARLASVGESIDPTGALVTGEGAAVLDLAGGIALVIGPRSTLRASRAAGGGVEVRLERGGLTASVTPGRGERRFAVTTDGGRVEVKGTVFSVDAGEQTAVRVLRGRVELTADDGARLSLGPSQRAVLGQSEVYALDDDEERRLARDLGLAELADARDDSSIEVRSVPAGVPVKIDGQPVGTTPLTIALRAGHYQLVLDEHDGESVRELIDLGPGERLSRLFDLKRPGAVAPATADAGVRVPPAPGRRPAERASEADLLARAQSRRADRDWVGAARAYRELLERYPGSARAHAALVSLGEIQLEKLGDAGGALANFERYLARGGGGPLAQEALFDKARALRALGRSAGERRALEQFVARFPSAANAGRARGRLAELAAEPPTP